MSYQESQDHTHAPDVETASAGYAARFSGSAGAYLLETQEKTIRQCCGDQFGEAVLEVGGGHGQLRALHAGTGVPFTLHGSDERCFARLPDPIGQERRVVSDLRSLPFEDQSFETVIAVRLLCHLNDWDRVLAEMCRVASRQLVFDFPTNQSLNGLTPLLFRMKKHVEKNTRTYESFSIDGFDEVLKRSGFRRVRIVKQFFLPMVIHRVMPHPALSRMLEALPRWLGLTRWLGSPVILKAERVHASEKSL